MSSTENNAEVAVEKQVDAVEAEEKTEKAEVKGAKRPAEVSILVLNIVNINRPCKENGKLDQENAGSHTFGH